jgi:aspartyl-tRNA(Asn)/glutamyl-tRNA(Gln) amidotransferase subunit C
MSDDELDAMASQLDVIIGAVSRVQEVAADDIAPTSHAVPLTNVLRADEARPSLTAAEALAAAPAAEDDRFRVPRILDEE